ncbi:MAG: GNAT family N-acyltransferase [Pseudomonadota bacterium]
MDATSCTERKIERVVHGLGMKSNPGSYRVKLAETEEEILGARRLRYRVFVEEKGASARQEEHALRQEWDQFDPHFDHLVLIADDPSISDPLDRVVGAYRLMRGDAAKNGVGFYSASEYDLELLQQSGRRLVELGRSCISRDHRGGLGMHLLWSELAAYVLERDIEILFGVASFHGTDPGLIADALAYLYHNFLAPRDLRVRALEGHHLDMNLLPDGSFNTSRASSQIPPLLKSYLRLGGFVGDGAFIDRGFNTIDVCVVMDTKRMKQTYRRFYERGRSGSV